MPKVSDGPSLFEILIKNKDRDRVEPLVSLICYYLARHKPARASLRKLIKDEWPDEKSEKANYIDRMIDKPIQHKSPDRQKTEFMIELIVDHGVHLIQTLPETPERENPRRLATLFYNALIGETTSIDLTSDPVTRKKDALNDLFGVRPSQINETQNIEGDYFGYRRSTTRGTVIRFSLSIRDRGGGIYHFENHFRSRLEDWIVTGTGFFKDGNLYLVGNASSEEGSLGRGLRCFALRPEARTRELISGVVLTTESSNRPIGARILLVPVRNHRDPRLDALNETPLDLAQVLANPAAKPFWVTDEVNVSELNRTIIGAGPEPSDMIVKSIRNGTVSTLRFDGCAGESDKSADPDENFLLEFLEEAIGNPTILYLRAIKGAEGRMKQGRS
jgi:hypothetical protein